MSRSLLTGVRTAPRDALPAPSRSLALALASLSTREGQPRPALTRLEGATSLDRHSAIHIVSEREERERLEERPRNCAARKAGAM